VKDDAGSVDYLSQGRGEARVEPLFEGLVDRRQADPKLVGRDLVMSNVLAELAEVTLDLSQYKLPGVLGNQSLDMRPAKKLVYRRDLSQDVGCGRHLFIIRAYAWDLLRI